MLLSFKSRVITRDIDALFSPDRPTVAAIREVANEMGWPTTWLNNHASSYVSRNPGEGTRVFDHPNLQVMTTPDEHLLAMKVLASRSVRDRGDIELRSVVDRYFPDVPIPDRARLLIEDLLAPLGELPK